MSSNCDLSHAPAPRNSRLVANSLLFVFRSQTVRYESLKLWIISHPISHPNPDPHCITILMQIDAVMKWWSLMQKFRSSRREIWCSAWSNQRSKTNSRHASRNAGVASKYRPYWLQWHRLEWQFGYSGSFLVPKRTVLYWKPWDRVTIDNSDTFLVSVRP